MLIAVSNSLPPWVGKGTTLLSRDADDALGKVIFFFGCLSLKFLDSKLQADSEQFQLQLPCHWLQRPLLV